MNPSRIYYIFCLYNLGSTLLSASQLRHHDIEMILTEHNRHRRDVAKGLYGASVGNMRKLTWSRYLQARATELLECSTVEAELFRHSYNINIGTASSRSFSTITNTWFREVVNLIPSEGTCVDLEECRHFLTMINADHHSIGCTYKRCHGKVKLLCMYEGGTDIPPVYKPGNECTKCNNDASFCEDGLCVACDPNIHNCDCRKTCRKPLVGMGSLDNNTCTCTCTYGNGPNCDEECKNQDMYVGWDICKDILQSECNSPFPEDRMWYQEFCPDHCGFCNKYPNSEPLSSLVNRDRVRKR